MMIYRKFLNVLSCPGAAWNYQRGGAIYVDATDVKIYTSIFKSNTAEKVSDSEAVFGEISYFFLQFPVGDMQLLGRRYLYFAGHHGDLRQHIREQHCHQRK
jgi:hypothetical protein